MKNKKILFINSTITAQSISLGIAGGEVRLAEIMRGFIRDKWEVHLLSNGGGEIFCKHFGLSKVINHNFNIKEGPSRLWFIIFTVKVIFKLPRELISFKGYLYTANELLFDVIPALKIKIVNQNKWAAVAHWMPPLVFWRRKQSNFVISLLFMLGEYICVFLVKYFSDIILAISEPTRKQLINARVSENKVVAVECGVHLKKTAIILRNNFDKNIDATFMKRIQAVKGVFDLIDIWRIVIRRKPSAKLAIIGGGIDNIQVLNLIKEKKLEDNIIFFGPIFDFEKKIKILGQSRLFVLPSYEENWAIVMGEAMACKIPVLAYDLPELIDVWKNSFVHIPLGNKQDFADKIIQYLENKNLRNKQAEIGYKYVQQFDWKEIAEREIQLIKNI